MNFESNTTPITDQEMSMPLGAKQINQSLYLGSTFRVWQCQNEWRFKTFGSCRMAMEGRASNLNLAMMRVAQCL